MSTSPVELAVARVAATGEPRPGAHERDRLIRRAKALSWLSLGYMTVEGLVAVAAALVAGSVALLGFGLDSAIEALASAIVIWRFTGSRRLSADAERRAEQLVAVSFFLLAPYLAQDAIRVVLAGDRPHTSWVGIGLSTSSLIVMPILGNAKRQIGRRLGSRATAGEGTQNLLCACLAAGVLVSLAVNASLGLWWVDPAVALGIALLAVNEGCQAWAGEACCVPSPLPVEDDCGCDACAEVGAGGDQHDGRARW
jgi:divalent metal cation (Fe/Co/Zn/Cd) transporter